MSRVELISTTECPPSSLPSTHMSTLSSELPQVLAAAKAGGGHLHTGCCLRWRSSRHTQRRERQGVNLAAHRRHSDAQLGSTCGDRRTRHCCELRWQHAGVICADQQAAAAPPEAEAAAVIPTHPPRRCTHDRYQGVKGLWLPVYTAAVLQRKLQTVLLVAVG